MRSGSKTPSISLLRQDGFTLLEMLVVMALIGLLLTLAVPRYFQSLKRAREEVLVHNLQGMRIAIGRFQADKGRFPEDLKELVASGYLRAVPVDPIAETSEEWVPIPSAQPDEPGMADVRSGVEGEDSRGTPYADL